MSIPGQIEFLARAIVNRLEDRGVVEFRDAEAGIRVVEHVLAENFSLLESLEQEARARLGKDPSEAQLMEEMRRLAVERNTIL
ncbi:MAG TPA: hypothetical protein VJ901_22495 [Thermoanaerobaculia bacterium]|nr:hypothetical protein [Thermoanaerobaculia bacterium]